MQLEHIHISKRENLSSSAAANSGEGPCSANGNNAFA